MDPPPRANPTDFQVKGKGEGRVFRYWAESLLTKWLASRRGCGADIELWFVNPYVEVEALPPVVAPNVAILFPDISTPFLTVPERRCRGGNLYAPLVGPRLIN